MYIKAGWYDGIYGGYFCAAMYTVHMYNGF